MYLTPLPPGYLLSSAAVFEYRGGSLPVWVRVGKVNYTAFKVFIIYHFTKKPHQPPLGGRHGEAAQPAAVENPFVRRTFGSFDARGE